MRSANRFPAGRRCRRACLRRMGVRVSGRMRGRSYLGLSSAGPPCFSGLLDLPQRWKRPRLPARQRPGEGRYDRAAGAARWRMAMTTPRSYPEVVGLALEWCSGWVPARSSREQRAPHNMKWRSITAAEQRAQQLAAGRLHLRLRIFR